MRPVGVATGFPACPAGSPSGGFFRPFWCLLGVVAFSLGHTPIPTYVSSGINIKQSRYRWVGISSGILPKSFPGLFFSFSLGKNTSFKMEEKSDSVLEKSRGGDVESPLLLEFRPSSPFLCVRGGFNPREHVRIGFPPLPCKAGFSETGPAEMTLSSWYRNYLNKVFTRSFLGPFLSRVLF